MSRILERSSPLNLENVVAVVTGSSTGLGVSICRSLLNCNAFVLGVDVSDAHETTVGREGGGSHFQHLKLDITDPDAGDKIFKRCAAEFGEHLGVGLLLNVAAIYDDGAAVHEFEDTTLAKVLKVNLEAPVRMMRSVVGDMVKRGNAGVVINIVGQHLPDSAAGTGVAFMASKEGLVGATKHTAEAYKSKNVRCYAVAAGGPSENHPSSKGQASTRDVANVVLFLASAMGKGVASGEVVNAGWV